MLLMGKQVVTDPESIVVLYGGVGPEREVSLHSGQAISEALEKQFRVELLRIDSEALPTSIDGKKSIVFPALHGVFGEDGHLQMLLEDAGIHYSGSDARASRLCMAKDKTKERAQKLGIQTPKGIVFKGDDVPLADAVIDKLGASLALKPSDQGSSFGLAFTGHRSALGVALSRIREGNWLVEQRICGRELTVGLLNGKAMGVVEILSPQGKYDFAAKYTPGATEYRYPAELNPAVEVQIKKDAEALFADCGCRDFARIDFLLEDGVAYFLEINTLPGLTATSLLPKSASCVGLDFEALARELVGPAVRRFKAEERWISQE